MGFYVYGKVRAHEGLAKKQAPMGMPIMKPLPGKGSAKYGLYKVYESEQWSVRIRITRKD